MDKLIQIGIDGWVEYIDLFYYIITHFDKVKLHQI